jgi:hypothetical protein
MTIIASIPPTTLPAGPGDTKPAVDIPVGSNQMLVKLLKIGWPGDGTKAGDFVLSYSASGGAWIEIMRTDVWDVADDANPLIFAAGIPDTLNGRRRLQLAWTLVSGRQVSGTIEANTVAAKK